MLINRNNYENFFLLYADNELSAHERIAVENFIAQNPDLIDELEILEATKLTPDEITLTDKSFLYKEIVFDENLQHKLLLKLDNELPLNQSNEIDALLKTDAKAKAEFDLLAKAKLDASDKIIFEQKHLLYKKEKDNVVVFFRWAAAAVVIGLALFISVNYLKSKNDLPTNETVSTKNNKNFVNDNSSQIISDTTIITNNNNVANTTIKSNNTFTDNDLSPKIKTENNQTNIVTILKDKRNTINTTITKNELIDTANTNQFIAQKTMVIDNSKSEVALNNNEIIIAQKNKIEQIKNNELVPLEDTYSSALTYAEIEKSDNKIFYINEDAVKKTKAGGFLRKVKRFVEKTANIKPGNTIQIAGFEFAAK
jgi:hypothetical protein